MLPTPGFNGGRSSYHLVALTIVALVGCNEAMTEPSLGGLSVVTTAPATGVPGWMLRDTMKVRVVNTTGRPRSGAIVTWAVTAGGGSISPVRDTTDADGLALAVWTLGPQAGLNEVTARASDKYAATLSTVAEAVRVDHVAGSVDMGCGLVAGELWCWGKDSWTSTAPVSLRPSPPFGWLPPDAPGHVDGASGLTEVAVSGNNSVCALDGSGSTWCASESQPTLAKRTDLPPLRRLRGAAWGWGSYCGLAAADSIAWCWRRSDAAAAVPGSPAFVDLDIDGNDEGSPFAGFLACGTLADSTAACWGSGSLGDGSSAASATPVVVSGGHHFAEVAVGELFACGRKSNGEVWCWGRNGNSQLAVSGPDAPSPILSTTGVTHITASQDVVLAIKAGSLVRWGGGLWLTPGPVASLAGLPVADLAAQSMECVSLADGQVYCIEEMWDNSSVWSIDTYGPVPPLVDGAQ